MSLLNTDQKILAKSLASRLSPLMPKLIHPDQIGFIPNRYSSNNFRWLFNIMYSPRYLKEALLILSLDADKAFDWIEWYYLYVVLGKFGLGARFISLVKPMYNNSTARILTNQTISDAFNLYRGTRQGCALRPLLFALALEPLAETIRAHKENYGCNTDYTLNKISLYADDILMYITRPQISIPTLLETIELFGSFSG